MKRVFDVLIASIGLITTSPILLGIALAIFAYDWHSPLYISSRVGRGGRPFRMIKFRSMIVNADRTGVTSTSAADSRITPVGRIVRRFKLDELVQLWNVLEGKMSLVGPRPNVPSGVAVYTVEEMRLLGVRPGLTDFASIVFADEGEILQSRGDPDLAYDQLIRPWKSRLGILYVEKRSLWLDIKLVFWTALAMLSRRRALRAVARQLTRMDAPTALIRVVLREEELQPTPPPGATRVVTSRY